MIRAGLFASIILAACGAQSVEPNAQDKLNELLAEVIEASTGTEFTKISESLGHECERNSCSMHCQQEVSGVIIPDELLVCRWDEHRGSVSVITFGTVLSVIYLAEDRIVSRDIEVIYTGP